MKTITNCIMNPAVPYIMFANTGNKMLQIIITMIPP